MKTKIPDCEGRPAALNSLWTCAAVLVLLMFDAPARSAETGFTHTTSATLPALYDGSASWGDYDNDGDLDLVLTGMNADGLPVSLICSNRGNGVFVSSGITLPGVYSGAAAWGDCDNDGDLDLVLCGATSLEPPYAPVTRLFINQGNGSFLQSSLAFPGISEGTIAWGDYDHDGDLDLVITGWGEINRITRIYQNDGGTFTDSGISLVPLGSSCAAWADYDNDGNLDLILAGTSSSGRITRLYRNNGNETFSDSGAILPGISIGALEWGDYDNDGDPDLFIGGSTGTSRIARIYRNVDGGSFVDSGIILAALSSSACAWGDFDADGDLDLLLTGNDNSGPVSLLYTNSGGGTLADSGIAFPAMAIGSVAWGDCNRNGKLDAILIGFSAGTPSTILSLNTGTISNSPPAVLTGLKTELTGRTVKLSWNQGTDDQTPSAGLHYNLRLGTAPGGADWVNPMANGSTGFRRIAQFGNGNQANTWIMQGLPDGTYYWSVQAIDSDFAGGLFAAEGSFKVPANPPTSITLSPGEIVEDEPVGTVVGRFAAADLNVDESHNFALVAGPGDADNGSFTIAGDELRAAEVFNFETRSTYQVRVRATDPAGLFVENTFTISVLDHNDPPIAICRDQSAVAGPSGMAAASIDDGSFDPDAGDTIALSQSPPGPYLAGTNVVLLTVTDSRGASNSCVALVVVEDRTPPEIHVPLNLTLEAPAGECEAILNYYPAVTATDNCDPVPIISSIPPSGTALPVGRTQVICTAADASGNSNSASFTVLVYPQGREISGRDWVPRNLEGDPPVSTWRAIAASTNGLVVAAAYGGTLFVSTDFGASWTARENSRNWQSVACSRDGTKLVAAAYGGHLYLSADSGVSWTPSENNRNWSAVASSQDGSRLLASVYGGQLYTSTNSGSSWNPCESPRAWYAVACSSDGGSLIAADKGGRIYISTDAGQSWTPRAEDHNWTSVACSDAGDVLLAAVENGQLYTSLDFGANWAAAESVRAWSSVACLNYDLMAATVTGGQVFTSRNLGQDWTACDTNRAWASVSITRTRGVLVAFAAVNGGDIYSSWGEDLRWDLTAHNAPWNAVASSADGTRLVAAAQGGRIHTTTDAGTNWITHGENRAWSAVASSADGTKLIAAVNPGWLYTSIDSGENWIPHELSAAWRSVASSADGTRLAAAAAGGWLYTSTDSGWTWTPQATPQEWSGIASSADGTRLAAVIAGGPIHVSGDGGLTWTPRMIPQNWAGVASSADGLILAAVVSGGSIYVSTNFGITWNPRETDRDWSGITASADGTKLVALTWGGRIHVSTDSGATWAERDSNRYWSSVAASADGTRFVSTVFGGAPFTSIPTRVALEPPAIFGATNRIVGATTPGGTIVTFEVTATNTCQPNVGVVSMPPSGSIFPIGTNIVTCIASDAFDVATTNTFTVTVVERPEKGGWGSALVFDGTDAHVSAPDPALAGKSFTIELWARRSSTGTADTLFAQGTNVSGAGLWFGFQSDGRVVFTAFGSPLITPVAFDDLGWHHWAATFDPAKGRCIYLDGTLAASDSITTAYGGTGPLWIGAAEWTSDAGFDGSLDDVRIWNHARTGEEISLDLRHPLSGLASGFIAYWNFNEVEGNAVQDVTQQGRDGALEGSVVRTVSTVHPWGYALSFDGVDDYLEVPDGIYFGGDFTIEAMVFARSYKYWSRILDFGNGTPLDNVVFGLSDQRSGRPALHVFGQDYASSITAPNPVPTNQWIHLAVTLRTNFAILYVNGTPVTSGTVLPPAPVLRTNNYLGKSAWTNDEYLDASLDEVRIWNVARTEAEIQNTLGRPLTGAEPGLVAYWNFDEGTDATAFDSTAHLIDSTLINEPAWVASTVASPPSVTTLAAANVFSIGSEAVATLRGQVFPNMEETAVWFEWGTTPDCPLRTPTLTLNPSLSRTDFSHDLTDLQAGQNFYFRLVAENGYGPVQGATRNFSPLLLRQFDVDPLPWSVGVNFVDPGYELVNSGLPLGAAGIASGSEHSLAVRSDGSVVGWGGNNSGQLNIPPTATNASLVAAGGSHSLARRTDGTVLAWGDNSYSQSAVPAGLNDAARVSAGYFHSLILRSNGTVIATGPPRIMDWFPYFGQGVAPSNATNIIDIAAGGYHSLALASNGIPFGWGLNNEGQLAVPLEATNVVSIAAGHGHNLALRADGTVVAWGNDIAGQTIVPANATNIVAIAASGWHSLALTANGNVIAWGAGRTNTGNGLDFGQCMVPECATNVVAIAAGRFHSLALKSDGSVVAWGDNSAGQAQGGMTAISRNVNTSQAGVYSVTYSVTNMFGWATVSTRSIRVADRPSITPQPAINVTSGTVALQSLINPNGADTRAWFEWGTNTDYGNFTPGVELGEGFSQVSCQIELGELVPKASYHYRAIATNRVGTSTGPDRTFTVFSTDPSLSSLRFGLEQLVPLFDPAETNYTVQVNNQVGYLKLTAVTTDSGATMRARINSGALVQVPGGIATGPWFLETGTNHVEVQVTAQDGVTLKTYVVAVIRDIPSANYVGPSFPPLMGVIFNGALSDEQIGRASGATWTFSDAPLAATTPLFWGATNMGVKLSFNDNLFETNEVLTYQTGLSSPADGIAVWSGQTATPSPVRTVYTRFILAVTNTGTGAPVPLIDAASLGLATNIGAVARIDPGMSWRAVLRFQASFNANGPFEPALNFFDRQVATNIPAARAYSSFAGAFYHLNVSPNLTANEPLALDRSTDAPISPALLSATDLESLPAQLRFTIAPNAQGGSTRNGTLRLGQVPLRAGDSFTQNDLNNNNVVYVHDGGCETNDDFTFNVTDQHGGSTPTGEHTTYTFRITIAQPNLPPIALNGSGSTGLQAPFSGILPATNPDCAPQLLEFRLASLPGKGEITSLDTNTGAFTYVPAAGQTGTDSFTFQVNDGQIDSYLPGTFTITIANQAPVALCGTNWTRENVPCSSTVAASDPDLPPQPLTFSVASNACKGLVVITDPATGAFSYTPQPGAIGLDMFTFTASDGILTSSPAQVVVNICPNVEDGDLLISDGAAKQIVLVDSTGAQGVVTEGGLLTDPRGIAFDPHGTILVMDGGNGLIRIDPISGAQTVVCSITNFSTQPLGAWGIALEPSGSVLVADGVNGLVRVNTATGSTTIVSASNHLSLLISVAVAADGRAVVGNAAGLLGQLSSLVSVDLTTGAQTLIASGQNLFLPTGIAVEPAGDLLVTEAPSAFGNGVDLVLRINPTNGAQSILTSSNQLATPIGIARSLSGKLYAANMGSSTLVGIDPQTGDQSEFSAGPLLHRPAGMTVVNVSAPNILFNPRMDSGKLSVRFQGLAGRTYVLQRSTNLRDWEDVADAPGGLDGIANLADPNPPPGSAFYRVRLP